MKQTLCTYKHCKSHDVGVWVPVIKFYAQGVPRSQCPPGQVNIWEMRICHSCAQKITAHDLITDKRWAEICAIYESKGAWPPDRSTLELHLGMPKKTKEAMT